MHIVKLKYMHPGRGGSDQGDHYCFVAGAESEIEAEEYAIEKMKEEQGIDAKKTSCPCCGPDYSVITFDGSHHFDLIEGKALNLHLAKGGGFSFMFTRQTVPTIGDIFGEGGWI